MEVLTNLIITIAIVLFILKRMREVSQKGRDLTAPPVHRPVTREQEAGDDEEDMFPELRRFERGTDHEDEPRRDTDWMPVPEPPRRPATAQRRFEVPEAPPPPRAYKAPSMPASRMRRYHAPDEDQIETREDEESKAFDHAASRPRPSVIPVESEDGGAGKHHRKPSRGIVPHFGRRELIRGIIMREVLGPPVGMRSGQE